MAAIASPEEHLNIEIIVNDSPLEKYDDPNQTVRQPGRTVNYIEARSGANFTINYSFFEDFPKTNHLAVHAWLDGNGKLILAAQLCDQKPGVIDGVYSKVDGRWVKQPFRFDELIIAEFDGRPPNPEIVQALANKGEILITFSFVEKAEQAGDQDFIEKYELERVGQVKEQELKPRLREEGASISHQVVLGDADEVGHQFIFDVKLVEGSPFATIKYKYRSLASLKKEQVVPGTPSATPAQTPLEERDVDEMTLEEMREILRRQRADRDVQNQHIKCEHEEHDEEELRIKR